MSNRKLKRRVGKLKTTSGNQHPRHILLFDTETYVIENSDKSIEFPFRLGVSIYIQLDKNLNTKKREIFRFTDIDHFIDYLTNLLNKKQKLHIFAHNIGFDIRVLNLIHKLHERGYTSKPPIINNMIFIWSCKNEDHTLEFLDTSNLGVRSVARLGLDMGFEKMQVDFATEDDNELFTYCQRDVEILEKFVLDYIRYLRDNELGSFRVTLASQSLYSFRKRFMQVQPEIHVNEDALKLERLGYYGGRTECFFIGLKQHEPFYYVDVNSMYPYVMKSLPMPVKLTGYDKEIPLSWLKTRMKGSYNIARVTIESCETVYPYRHEGKLIFPIGRFETTLHHYELDHAIKRGHIKAIHEIATYDKAILFADYVNFFYAQKVQHKLSGNVTNYIISKLFQNSLYGKFGQMEYTTKIMGSCDPDLIYREIGSDSNKHTPIQYIYWNGVKYQEYREGETLFSCPSIAGAVTAYARMLLWSYIDKAGKDNVFYCDTDSLIVNQQGFDNLQSVIDETRLGYLALEDTSTYVKIFGNKDYQFAKKKRHKGISKNAHKTKKNTWEYLQFHSFIKWLNDGAIGGASGEIRTKSRKTKYNKGIVMDNGKVKPIFIDKDSEV